MQSLLDTGAGSSYAYAALLDRILKSSKRKREVRKIEMLLGTSTREVELAMIDISDVNRKFSMPVEVTKVDKGELLFLDNRRYQEMIAKYPHLSGVVMNDLDTKCRLPVHLILGAGEYAKLKTENSPKIGEPGQPIAELTKFGWTIMSAGKEPLDLANVLLTQTSHVYYEELCRLDVLGLTDTPPNDQRSVYAEFKEQLMRDKEGWYETGLPWRRDHPVLPNNKEGSLRRLGSLNKRLERQNLTSEYEEIILKIRRKRALSREQMSRAWVDENSTYRTNRLCEPPQNRRSYELCMTLLQEPLMALHPSTIVYTRVRPCKTSFGAYWLEEGSIR